MNTASSVDELARQPHTAVAGRVACELSSRPRRILYIIDRLNNTSGGAEGALARLCTLMPTDRYECSVACFSAGSDIRDFFHCPVEVFPLNSLWGRETPKTALRLRRYIVDGKFDIVHTFFPASDIMGSIVARTAGVPLLLSSRRDLGILRSTPHRLAYRVVNLLFDRVHSVSDSVKDFCISHDHMKPETVVTIRNGIDIPAIDQTPPMDDLAEFGFPSGVPVVATVANIRSVKGIDTFVCAAAAIHARIPECRFLVVGYHQEEEAVRKIHRLIHDLGLTSRFSLPGLRSDVVSILKRVNAFCLPSRSEGLSNALLEAMACGLPCVATNVGGNAEVIRDGSNGFLVPAERQDLLADRLLRVMSEPALASHLGHCARQTIIDTFSAEKMTAEFVSMYDDLFFER